MKRFHGRDERNVSGNVEFRRQESCSAQARRISVCPLDDKSFVSPDSFPKTREEVLEKTRLG
ncbi:MAG: hypothetical protein G01um1014106_395 [Parcubacteria group bacterium Gr01-1014_106]|nr:MAG: hypothetical protein G01um1014106_395 [Parcubacteria group bacterium Gr01-1014_106]